MSLNFFLLATSYCALFCGSNNLSSSVLIDVNAKDSYGNTELTRVASKGNKDEVDALLKKGAKIEAANNNLYTALMRAALNGNKEVVEVLLRWGAKIEAADIFGNTPLILAAGRDNKEVIEILLRWGAKIEAADIFGNTPLILAADRGNEEVVEVLLRWGAKIEAVNNNGDTALTVAKPGMAYFINKFLKEQAKEVCLHHTTFNYKLISDQICTQDINNQMTYNSIALSQLDLNDVGEYSLVQPVVVGLLLGLYYIAEPLIRVVENLRQKLLDKAIPIVVVELTEGRIPKKKTALRPQQASPVAIYSYSDDQSENLDESITKYTTQKKEIEVSQSPEKTPEDSQSTFSVQPETENEDPKAVSPHLIKPTKEKPESIQEVPQPDTIVERPTSNKKIFYSLLAFLLGVVIYLISLYLEYNL